MRRLAPLLLCCALAGAAHAQSPPSAPDRLAGLTLTEVTTTAPGDTFAVIYSGDGGWAAIDKGMASALAKAGVPTVGVSSLQYFWTARTPQGAAADLAAMIQRYSARWGRKKVLVIGYSFGADALPIIVSKLSPEVRSQIRLLALTGIDSKGELHLQLGDFLNKTAADAYDIAPVLAELKGVRTVCIYGDGEKDDACPTFPAASIRQIRVPGGHHFGGDYEALGRLILSAAP